MSDDGESLRNPPRGGTVRQWEALGMSRASWYRHGKPAEKPTQRGQGPFSQRKMAAGNRVSLRTQQRIARIIESDFDLAMMVLDGEVKPGQAEKTITDPLEYQCFLEWYGRQLSLTDYVKWTIRRQLDALEGLWRGLRRGRPLPSIRRLRDGESVIYLPPSDATDGRLL